ncbi:MAG: hypothetical protein MUF51_09565, partial [Vicinamibacteria bacterium]|nr:hypothetical protein [Vicinamibacteria bacterium]
ESHGERLAIIVYRDELGSLRLTRADSPAVPGPVREQLLAHEAIAVPRYLVGTTQIFLMEIDDVLSIGDTPGVDDPLWLTGRLHGPFARFDGMDAGRHVDGRLSTTRRELLASALHGAPHAIHVTATGRAGRLHHLVLPGEDVLAISRGVGIILAYPRPKAFSASSPGNELEVAVLLRTTLLDLQADLRRTNADGAFVATEIPEVLERVFRETEAPARAAHPTRRWFARIASLLVTNDGPAAGGLEDFLRLAHQALSGLEGALPARMKEVLARIRVDEAYWTPRAALGLAPVFYKGNGEFRQTKEALVLPRRIARQGGNFNFLFTKDALYYGRDADLDLEIEYLDRDGSLALCYRPTDSEQYATIHGVTMANSGKWQTLTLRAPRALTNLSLWNSDFCFYCVSRHDVAIRRVTVRLSRSQASHKKEVGVEWSRLTRRAGGRGWLDDIGGLPKPALPDTPYRVPRREQGALLLGFDLTIQDVKDESGDGDAYLVLAGESADYSIPAPIRTARPDLEQQLPAFARSGRKGVLRPREAPPGRYRILLRLLLPDRAAYVEVDTGLQLELVDSEVGTLLKSGGVGRLERLGHQSIQDEVTLIARDAEETFVYSGWIADQEAGWTDGSVVLRLVKSDGSASHCYDAQSRHAREQVAEQYKNESLRNSGFTGVLAAKELPPCGLYIITIDLIHPDGLVYVRVDLGRWLKVVESAADIPAARSVVSLDSRQPSS